MRKRFIISIALLFAIGGVKAQYTKLLDFSGANGNYPYGSLIYDGTYLYGMTNQGGSGNKGVVFRIKPDGTGDTVLLNFTGLNGRGPTGDLFYDGSYLYGMTAGGGTNNMGVVFQIKTDGTGYNNLLNFAGVANGANPYGSLFSDGVYLYGMTFVGGSSTGPLCGNGCGTIFKIMPNGIGYTKLLDFAGPNGSAPSYCALISDGTYLYGTTGSGTGSALNGAVFKIKPDGSGDTVIYNCVYSNNGYNTNASLFYDGTSLYGMTSLGGVADDGVIFRIMPNGSGYTKLLDFTGVANGSNPNGALISDGIFLYGMTGSGGAGNTGTIFKIMPNGTGYTKMFGFTGTATGDQPLGSLMAIGSTFYGMTSTGGANGMGVIFRYDNTLGISANEINSEIRIFPNPSCGLIQITSGVNQITHIEVYNFLGENIFNSIKNNAPQTKIDLSIQEPGIYFISVETEKGTTVQKINIEH